jgi:hypothetical protein
MAWVSPISRATCVNERLWGRRSTLLALPRSPIWRSWTRQQPNALAELNAHQITNDEIAQAACVRAHIRYAGTDTALVG